METISSDVLLKPQTAIKPKTLLAPDCIIGVAEDTKKWIGYIRVIVPPSRRDVVGVNARVAGTKDFPTTRSDEAMVKEGVMTCENMPPDATGLDASTSVEVCTVTSVEPDVTGPMVNPLNVTMNTFVLMVAPDIVAIRAVAVVVLQVNVSPATLLAPTTANGRTEGAKKPEG